MAIIDQRTFQLVKGSGNEEVTRQKQRELDFEGYLGKDLFLNTEDKEMDIMLVQMRWESKEHLMNFKKSDQHREGHKNRKPNPNILNHSMKIYSIE